MFLTRISQFARRSRRVGTDDGGFALPAVIAFMAAGVILTAVVATTVVSALQVSSSTRAGVQSQAAAEAGIAFARAVLIREECADPALYAHDGALDDPDTTTDESEPAFDAQIQYSNDGGTTWVNGCPPSVAVPARILSTGYALTPGVAAADSGDSTTVEARLAAIEVEPPPPPTTPPPPSTIDASGPAVYSFSTAGFGGSGKLISTSGLAASIMIRSGNVRCDGAANGAADLVVKSGNFEATGSCVVAGNVWVNGSAILAGGARINGALTAGSVNASGAIGGNVYSDSTLKLGWGGNVGGWATGNSLEIAGGTVAQSAWARTGTTTVSGGGVSGVLWSEGAVTQSNGTVERIVSNGQLTLSGGTVSTSARATALRMTNGTLGGGAISGAACFTNGTVSGALTVGSITSTGGCYTKSGQSWWGGWSKITVAPSSVGALDASPSKPSAATVPEWVDFGANPVDLTTERWTGYTLVTMGSDCSSQKFYAALQTAGSNPALIDARACANGLSFGGGSGEQTGQGQNANGYRLRNDTAIIGRKIDFSGSSNFFAHSGTVDLWLINPDTIANASPDCGGQSISISGGFYTTNVNVMFYTPCPITLSSSTTVKGQIFAGNSVTFGGSGLLDYMPLGLPGYDLNTGMPVTTTPGTAPGTEPAETYTEADRALLWQRNVTGAG